MRNLLNYLFISLCLTQYIHHAKAEEISVQATKAENREFYERYKVIGKAKAKYSKSYYAKISGDIDEILVEDGQDVKMGQILLSIDKELANAAKIKATESHKIAEINYNRDLPLVKKNIISQESFEKTKLALSLAKADMILAEGRFDDMIIKVPFDGHIGVLHFQENENVNIGDYLFTIIAPGEKTVIVEIPENLYHKIRSNSEVIATDLNFKQINGKILSVSDYVQDNGTIALKIEFPAEAKIIHNSFIEADIFYNRHIALSVPEKVILKNNEGNFLYKINDGKIQQIYVETGIRADGYIAIKSKDITEGDNIVEEGLTKVVDGSKVNITDNRTSQINSKNQGK